MEASSSTLPSTPSARIYLPSPSPHFSKKTPTVKFLNPSPRLRISMAVQSPERTSPSFLDGMESPLLHFVKYHGLGNDFIMVTIDMVEPILKASDVLARLAHGKGHSVIKSNLEVDGVTWKIDQNKTWKVTCVSMGNPHCVTFGTEDDQKLEVDKLKLAEIGPKFEHHEMFPARTNTEFVQVFSPLHLKMRVWERGAGREEREEEEEKCRTGR